MTKEQQTTPVVDLDGIMDDALDIFGGEQTAAAETDTHKEKPGAPESSSEEHDHGPAKKAEEPGEHPDGEHPKEKASQEQGQETTREKKPLKLDKIPKKPLRFQSHEAAEEGFKEIQREKTRLEQELKIQREENAQLAEAEATKVREQEVETDVRAYAKGKNLEALEKIENLDPDQAEYREQVAEIQADVFRDITRYEREKIKAATPAVKYKSGDATVKNDDALKNAQDRVRELATEQEINPDDEYFTMICKTAPTQDENGVPMKFDEQVLWAVNKTKTYQKSLSKGAAGPSEEELAAEKARENQEANLTLGRSTGGKPGTDTEKEPPVVTLNDALVSAREERRL